jgi:hypothetical protein
MNTVFIIYEHAKIWISIIIIDEKKLHLQHCSTVLFKKSVINMGISLYNMVPDQEILWENFNLFKKDLKSFLLNHSSYSVDEFMSFYIFNMCIILSWNEKNLVFT